MKKFFAIAFIAASLVACNNSGKKTDVAADSARIADSIKKATENAVDTLKAKVEGAIDSLKGAVDSLKPKM